MPVRAQLHNLALVIDRPLIKLEITDITPYIDRFALRFVFSFQQFFQPVVLLGPVVFLRFQRSLRLRNFFRQHFDHVFVKTDLQIAADILDRRFRQLGCKRIKSGIKIQGADCHCLFGQNLAGLPL